jgi:hypothetical protein
MTGHSSRRAGVPATRSRGNAGAAKPGVAPTCPDASHVLAQPAYWQLLADVGQKRRPCGSRGARRNDEPGHRSGGHAAGRGDPAARPPELSQLRPREQELVRTSVDIHGCADLGSFVASLRE